MKVLPINGYVHLVVLYNDGPPGTYKDGGEGMPKIPAGFHQTACGRTYSGQMEDQKATWTTCTACKGTTAYEQALVLEEMQAEAD